MLKKVILALILCFIVISVNASVKTRSTSSCKTTWDNIQSTHNLDPLYKSLIGLCGIEFRKQLWEKIATNEYLDYKDARVIMFSHLDNVDGKVCGVYSGTCIETSGIPDPSKYNTEHSWCQSWGATGKAKSDLHHLYPVKSNLNSKRNNFPFCEVSDVQWEDYGSYFGHSFSGTTCFEPPNWHKGELARSMFYFSVRYSRPLDSEQEKFFREWNAEIPVSEKEYYRNEDSLFYQGNRNPFVQYPEFVQLISDY